ncbi:Alg9-like mannosyltransferase family-domain-containing protein [Rhypophila decipiens]|uniref:Mannosyltransferase n=1 Tax=Rhypophila decipiens TaxID=261697 RepID=A0AAN7BAG2_9PEZI|nr:Alg9-like mannosyltransferase family-domain-containing protein [Rhypophila decipiens]
MKLLDIVLSLLIPGLVLIHLIMAPYTKVEESFNIQAAHDILVYGTPTSDIHHKLSTSYDHFTFPGAVPRTFIGAVLLAGIAQPFIALAGFHNGQFIVRAVLGLFNAASILLFARNIRKSYGVPTARWYLILQASQFHVIYYASRTLPNMFAFGLTTLAFSFLLPSQGPSQTARRNRLSITLFVFAAAVFRSEVALLLGTDTLCQLLAAPRITTSLEAVVPPFLISFLVALGISVPLDSYFWQKPIWPELAGFYFNAIKGSASEWGTSPVYWYFTSALPRLLNPVSFLFLLPLSLWHPALRPAGRRLVIPCLLFVAIYSLQPHKEARFIFYVVPPLTAACALSANLVFNRAFSKGSSSSSHEAKLLGILVIVSVIIAFAGSSIMLLFSSLNYPGGEALSFLRDTILQSEGIPSITSQSSSSWEGVSVIPAHADVLSCMTGITLFGTATGKEIPNYRATTGGSGSLVRSQVTKLYADEDTDEDVEMGGGNGQQISSTDALVTLALDKTEDEALLLKPEFWTRFDYALAEEKDKVRRGGEWDVIGLVKGFGGVEAILEPSPSTGQEKGVEEEAERDLNGAVIPVVGRGALVERVREVVMRYTGGRWIGPRMVPRIYILRRVKDTGRERKRMAVEA